MTQTFRNQPPELVTQKGVFPVMSIALLAAEPCLFSTSETGVGLYGGPLTKKALEFVQNRFIHDIYLAKEAGLSAIIDVRVQRLMPGMYPAIPGWHCDAVPRDAYHGQPNFDAVDNRALHVSLTLSSEAKGVSNTEFVTNRFKPYLHDKEHVYKDLHEQVEKFKPDTAQIPDGVFVKFTPKTIHRATETHRRGWRMFFRFSMYHKPPIANGVNGQQQVYILSEKNGW